MEEKLRNSIRRRLLFFIAALVVSGLTAIPLETESNLAVRFLEAAGITNSFADWIQRINHGIVDTALQYPFIGYGTDWLAFGHLVIALFFIGPLSDPIRNRWVIQVGIISCALVFPLALIMGPLRGIPFFWQCIDCCFGLAGGILLFSVSRSTRQLEKEVIKRTGYKY